MKLSTGFAILAVALSTPAAAQQRAEETSGRVRINDVGTPHATPPARKEWVELADPSPVKHGTENVIIGEEAGNFGRLRIDATSGRVVVVRVRVTFDDGTRKTFNLNKNLRKKGDFVVIDLGTQRHIDRIGVVTETYTRGEFAVYGSSATAAQVAHR